MRRTTLLRIVAALVFAGAASTQARAACSSGNFTRSFEPYYSVSYQLPPFAQRDETAESICDIKHRDGQRICEIKLWGALYRPTTDKIFAQFPALIFNHGSGEEFNGATKYCELGKYFAERGFLVFIPFRRGQGDPITNHQSSGTDIGVLVDDFANNPAHHNTTCTTTQCYKAEILRLQADEEVAIALHHLKLSDQVLKDRDGKEIFAVGGNSYGGAVTVFFNRKDHGQAAALAFSPAAQNWGKVNFSYAAGSWDIVPAEKTLLSELLIAASDAQHPAFFLQAKWDYDTRATIDLAYAHTYGGDDPTHGNRFMASIFPYPKPGPDPNDPSQPNYQSVHTGFIGKPELWGCSVLAFLKVHGVEGLVAKECSEP